MFHFLQINHPSLAKAQLDHLQKLLQDNACEADLLHLDKLLQGNQLKQFHTTLIGSQFAGEQLCKQPQWLVELLSPSSQNNLLRKAWDKQHYQKWFYQNQEQSLQDWNKQLRQQRNKAMSRIIWRDFNRLSTTQETTLELTYMAESAIQITLDYHYQHQCQELGVPLNETGQQQPMLVIGMGKLGAWELNLSSDVDLIFAYPESGKACLPETPKKALSNQEFFTKLGQKVIQSLDQNTADGFVFRVDMRLRPYGQSGALVSNFNALEDYYQHQGREWERFAMIKARVIAQTQLKQETHPATSNEHEQTLMQMLRSFTYRRYVDFSAIDALRNLKQLITREVKRRRLDDNIKLGAGGIREVEFIAQAFQIIRGGRDTQLQNRQLLEVLPLLPGLNCLPQGMDTKLSQAYLFLRNTEHAIQGYQDRQTQELPSTKPDLSRIAYIMGYEDSQSFRQQLETHRNTIHQQFNDVIAPLESETTGGNKNAPDRQGLADWKDLWQSLNAPMADNDELKQQDLLNHIAELGFQGEESALKTLRNILHTPSTLAMEAISRQRLDELMPRLLLKLSSSENPAETLERLSNLLISIARRSAYLLLLIENPQALAQLITLSEASPWITDQLAQHPALLDELLNPSSLYETPPKKELTQDLQQHMLRVEKDDLEGQMEGLRHFRSVHSLRVAACEVTGRIPLMKVSDYLSDLAEVICEYSLQIAWLEMTARHGYPDSEPREAANFIIVGYGKLGGIELGHNSDLDLVFIHNGSSNGQSSGVLSSNNTPERIIDNHTFYTRLGQKIIHMLSTRTPSGQLYDVDMRLRPSGNSGLLTSSLQAYEKYQLNNAWTWEHQALVRARPIAGCNELTIEFQKLRQKILSQKRDEGKLKQDVCDMRQKMRTQLGSSKKQQEEGLFHLKQDTGGIVDIEFMVQYAVLAWAEPSPKLTQYTDNIRILENLKDSKQIPTEDIDQLISIYKTYRSKGHSLALQQKSSVVQASEIDANRQIVKRIWQNLLSKNS